MATVLFWNINKKDLRQDLRVLCRDHNVDVLILAECKQSDAEILEALNFEPNGYETHFNYLSSRLSFFFRYNLDVVTCVFDEGGVSIRQLLPPIGESILLVGLHLPSKLHWTEDDQKFHARHVAEIIQEAESQVGHSRTLAIGDFNMNPFEAGLVSSDGFHAVMTQPIAQRGSRQVQGQQSKPFFYNPMWGLMGDSSPGSPGTYYFDKGGYVNYFWNTFDQALLRPDLLKYFSQDNLKVISQIGNKSLVTHNGLLKSASDHLPLLIKLEIERM
jgi:exonuclease III